MATQERIWKGSTAFAWDYEAARERPPVAYCTIAMHRDPISVGTGPVDVIPLGYPAPCLEERPTRVVTASLSLSMIRSAATEMGLDPYTLAITPRLHVGDPTLEHLSWALVAQRESSQRQDMLFAEGIGRAMSAHIVRRYTAERAIKLQQRLSKGQLNAVVDYINENLAADLSLAELASVARVSASYFSVLFRRTTGSSVHQYVLRSRVEHAMRALMRRGARLAEVAQDAGFTDQSHMARCMRRIVGTTPAAFMREFRRQA